MNQTTIWQRLQTIDRRVIYLILIGFILVPLFLPKFDLPILPSRQSRDFYQTVEEVARTNPNSIVIVDGWWSPGTRGENQWQTTAILTHLMQKHLRFALLSFDVQNNTLMQNIAETLAPRFGYVYGTDWVNWGFKPSGVFPQTLKALVNDIPGAIKTDYKGRPITSFPVMQGKKTIKDVGAIIEITPSNSVAGWIGLVQGVNKTPLLYSPTAVMAPDAYPYLDSGQIAGMLTGVKGAGDYEKLTGTKSFGTQATGALSLVYALLIGLIILGNIGYFAGRRQERRENP